jgi:hypothetical protein
VEEGEVGGMLEGLIRCFAGDWRRAAVSDVQIVSRAAEYSSLTAPGLG